mgnify:CR=1 FL=1
MHAEQLIIQMLEDFKARKIENNLWKGVFCHAQKHRWTVALKFRHLDMNSEMSSFLWEPCLGVALLEVCCQNQDTYATSE